RPADINALLSAKPSPSVAGQLVEWAAATRNRIARGDMIIGILAPEEVGKIPAAYRAAAAHGVPEAWLALAWWHANPQIWEAGPGRGGSRSSCCDRCRRHQRSPGTGENPLVLQAGGRHGQRET